MNEKHDERVACRKCRHFYITWDKAQPYGCKAMGFKSKVMPNLVTRQVSSGECLSYEEKAKVNR